MSSRRPSSVGAGGTEKCGGSGSQCPGWERGLWGWNCRLEK